MTRTAALRKRVQAYLAEQRELVRTLLKLRAQLQGSVFARYGDTFDTQDSGADYEVDDVYDLVAIVDRLNGGVDVRPVAP